jgi:hypothetical protein
LSSFKKEKKLMSRTHTNIKTHKHTHTNTELREYRELHLSWAILKFFFFLTLYTTNQREMFSSWSVKRFRVHYS